MVQDKPFSAFETFLVEDVILTLGNLRGALDWLLQPDGVIEPGALRGGLERMAHQLALLDDRAHLVCRTLRSPAVPPSERARAPYAGASGISLEHLLRDALAEGPTTTVAPFFRSSRIAHG